MEVIVKENIIDAIPFAFFADMNCMGHWQEDHTGMEVQLYSDRGLILLEAERIRIATYPKGAHLAESIIVHPRYANKKDFDIVEVRGYRNGRNIDILLPHPYDIEGKRFEIINVKGVGASAHEEKMMMEPEKWYDWKNKRWLPFNESKASLGRRWGMLDTYAGTAEYNNNIFEKFGIAQVPHLRINHAPDGILPFNGVTQLVRGLKTNVRCDNDFANGWLQKQYVFADTFATIDSRLFDTQKTLYKEHKSIVQPIGRVANNRYLDGKYTDMENYTIKQYGDDEQLIAAGANFCMDVIASMSIANWDNRYEYDIYLGKLQTQTGIPLKQYSRLPVEIFMDMYISQEHFKQYIPERKEMFQGFLKDYGEFLKN